MTTSEKSHSRSNRPRNRISGGSWVLKAIARARGNPERMLEDAEEKLRECPLTAKARPLFAKGSALRYLSRFEESLKYIRDSAELLTAQGERLDAARVRVREVELLSMMGRCREALDLACVIRNRIDSDGSARDRAELDLEEGSVHLDLHQSESADKHLARAMRRFKALHDRVMVADAAQRRVPAQMALGNFRRALSLAENARETFEEKGMKRRVAILETNLGVLHAQTGRYREALESYERALESFHRLRALEYEAMVQDNIAEVYLELNLTQEAAVMSRKAREIFSDLGLDFHHAVAGVNLARALWSSYEQRDGWKEAEQLLLESGKIFRVIGDRVFESVALVDRAALLLQVGRKKEALTAADKALQILEHARVPAFRLYPEYVRALTLERLGRWDQAADSFRQVLRRASARGMVWLSYRSQFALGRIAEEQGDDESSLQRYKNSVALISEMRSSLKLDDLRISFLEDKLGVYRRAINLYLRRGGPHATAAAFRLTESGKSRALFESLAATGKGEALASTIPYASRGPLSRVRQDLDGLYSRFRALETDPSPQAPALVRRLRRQVAASEREYAQALRRARLRHGERNESDFEAGAMSIGSIRETLPKGAALLEYVELGSHLGAFVLTSKKLVAFRSLCKTADVEAILNGPWREELEDAAALPAREAAGGLELSRRSLRMLYDLLVAPLMNSLGSPRRWIIIPSGLLHSVPFHALRMPEGDVLERCVLSYAPSAALARPVSIARGRRKLLVVTGPEGGAESIGDEGKDLCRLFEDSRRMSGRQATPLNLLRVADRFDLLHMACHATFRRDNPLFSSLHLHGGDLIVHDLPVSSLRARLVTLSACETGAHLVRPGDELLGLSRGFFFAGARALVMSYWRVHDEATRFTMKRFYEELSQGELPAEALRHAQLDVRERFPHPFHWAPFFLTGAAN